ncbi:myosin heavy chain, clone 203-like isoform X2 [Elysia marginata]|uniref:Myosin heavy chain, clone 203-like isoform X2 n=1 Tax=Elysia marginata TaxID=1093978 RepID=A0AAV4GAF9_9GAST|nr:myosin heavy chain, clone 203-like isoform X2 [Elysia marginata]
MMEKESAGRIPRELMHEQNDRLSNKHIQTLGFLQEMVNENKHLKQKVQELEDKLEEFKDVEKFAKESKEKIKDIQDSYLARADEINSMLAEKHRVEIMQVQEEKFELERILKEQILQMRHEIEALQAANKDLRDTAAEDEENDEAKTKLKEALKHGEAWRKENEELREEVDSLRSDLELVQSKKASDMSLIRDLKAENKTLGQDLQEVQQKATELEIRLDKALEELKTKKDDQEQLTLIENLRDKLKQLTIDRDSTLDREIQLKQDLLDLQTLKDDLKQSNLYLQSQLENLIEEYGHLSAEYARLRKRLQKDQDKKTFKDFVKLKRELNTLKDENQDLKSRTKPEEPCLLVAESPPAPRKKNSLEGTRTGAKKMLAIALSNQK